MNLFLPHIRILIVYNKFFLLQIEVIDTKYSAWKRSCLGISYKRFNFFLSQARQKDFLFLNGFTFALRNARVVLDNLIPNTLFHDPVWVSRRQATSAN